MNRTVAAGYSYSPCIGVCPSASADRDGISSYMPRNLLKGGSEPLSVLRSGGTSSVSRDDVGRKLREGRSRRMGDWSQAGPVPSPG